MPASSIRLAYLGVVIAAWCVTRPVLAHDLPDASVPNALSKAYGVRIIWTFPKERILLAEDCAIEVHGPERRELSRYFALLAEEMAVYTPKLIKSSALKTLILCTGLSVNGQKKSGVTDSRKGEIYLDITAAPNFNDTYMRLTFHHELFHMLDSSIPKKSESDRRWSKLNPVGFQYGELGPEIAEKSETAHYNTKLGFLNLYATSSVDEDKAILFASMIVDYDLVLARAERDLVVCSKANEIKRRLAELCPEFDRAFWRKVFYRSIKTKGLEPPKRDQYREGQQREGQQDMHCRDTR